MADEIKKLIDGNTEFRKRFFGDDTELFSQLVRHGQRPKIMIVACSDSRVDPAMIFNCQPGDLFVIRNVANLVPPCEQDTSFYHGTSAALEFGVRFLEVEHIIVFGHTQCGGVQALVESIEQADTTAQTFITKWMGIARNACKIQLKSAQNLSFAEKATLCEQAALINSVQNLQQFPWIAEKVAQKRLSLHAWHFDLATGFIHRYNQQTHQWISTGEE